MHRHHLLRLIDLQVRRSPLPLIPAVRRPLRHLHVQKPKQSPNLEVLARLPNNRSFEEIRTLGSPFLTRLTSLRSTV